MPSDTGKRYRICREAGRGKRAVVHEAVDTVLHRTVALKVAFEGSGKRCLLEEAQRLARVRSPHVAVLYDVVPDDSQLVLEWLSGQTLRQCLSEATPLPFDSVSRYTEQLLRAVDACHAVDILHGDIKPENLWIDAQDNVKLFDFGTTPRPGGDATALYAPAEVLQGGEHSVQSDLYCIGSVVFEMLTGQLPFDSADADELAQRKSRTAAPTISRSGGTANDLLEAWVARALQRNATDRFESTAQALDSWQQAAASMRRRHGESQASGSLHAAVVDTLTEALPASGWFQGAVLTLTGVAGLGKSDVLRRLEEAHDGTPRLVVRGRDDATTWRVDGLPPEMATKLRDSAGAGTLLTTLQNRLQDDTVQDILVLVDDFERCPSTTRQTLVQLAQQAERLRVGLVAATRPALGDALAAWCDLQAAAGQSLQLEAPSIEGLQQTLHTAAGAEVPEALAAYVHNLTGGNPRFSKHLLEDLESRGAVERRGTTLHFEAPSEDRVPEESVPFLERQLSRLDETQRQLLVTAAVHGLVVAPEDLHSDGNADATGVAQSLHEIALHSDFLQADGDGSYRFGMPLLQLYLENSLAPAQRREAHAAIAARLETQEDADPAALGHHLFHAERVAEALPRLQEAGRRALEQHAIEQARRLLHLALRCHAGEPASEEDAQSLAGLLLLQAQTMARLASWDSAFALLDRCLLLSQAWGLQQHEVQAIRWRGRFQYKQGRFDNAITTLREAQEAAQRTEDAVEAHELALQIGNIDFELGRLDGALENYMTALLFATENNDAEMEARASNNVALVYSTQGNKSEAIRMFTRAVKVFKRLRRDDAVARIQHNIGMTYLDLHNWSEARNYFHDSIELSEKIGLDEITAVSRLEHAETNLRLGRVGEAKPDIEKALALCEQRNDPLGTATAHRLQGMVAAHEGDAGRAERLLQSSIELLRDLGETPHLGLALKERGRLQLEAGDDVAARQSLNEARRIFEALETPHEGLEEVNALWEACQNTPE